MKRVFAFIGFTCAITLAVLNICQIKICIIITAALTILFALSLTLKQCRKAKVIPVVLGAAILSCLLFILTMMYNVQPQLALNNQKVDVVFQIIDIPERTSNGYIYKVKTISVGKENAPQNIKIRLKTKRMPDADYYDTISANLTLEAISGNAYDSFGCFDDGIYLKSELYTDDYVCIPISRKPVNYYFIKLREKIKHTFVSNLKGDYAGLALALITGDKSELSNKVKENFRICGASHLMAVSGLHLSVLCSFLYFILKRINVNQYISSVIMIISILFYIGTANFSHSVIRAGIMMIILLVGKLINTKADTLNSLGMATFIICLNPFAVTDASAVLTVCAVLGITFLYPRLNQKITTDNKLFKSAASAACLNCCIIITTLPAIWIYFKSVSLIALFINVLLIPVADASIVLSLLFLIFCKIPILSVCIKGLVLLTTNIMLFVTEQLAEHFSFLYFNLNHELFGTFIALIFLFCGLCLLILGEVRIKAVSIFTAAALILSGIFIGYENNNSYKLYVLHSGCIAITNKNNLILIEPDDSTLTYYTNETVFLKNIHNTAIINSEYNIVADNLPEECNKTEINKKYFDIDLYNDIKIKYNSSTYTISIYDNIVTVNNDYVYTDNNQYIRDIYGKFGEKTDYKIVYYQFQKG